jgi:hypothetical protein
MWMNIGMAMKVHGRLGRGFFAAVYSDTFAIEIAVRSISFLRKAEPPNSDSGNRHCCGK